MLVGNSVCMHYACFNSTINVLYSTINVLLNKSIKGCSKLYSMIRDSDDSIINLLENKWSDKAKLEIESISISRSFVKHHTVYKDTYLNYIQFRTLHHRFYTND